MKRRPMPSLRSHLLVLLFVLDQVLSLATPVASGVFALGLLLWLRGQRRRLPAAPIGRAVAVVFVAGLVGSVVSGTGVQPLSVLTLVLLALVWRAGTRLPQDRALITPGAAMFGVLLSTAVLIPAQFGYDLFSWLRDVPANRPAGLYQEPSHFGLFVGPLWLIAFSRARHRLLLLVLMLYYLATLFSMSLAGLLGLGWAVYAVLAARSLRKIVSIGIVATMAIAGLFALLRAAPDLVLVGGVPLGDYATERVAGFFGDEIDENVGISPLVVLQGFEIAGRSFSASLGLGVGLGNLGVNEGINSTLTARELVNRITEGNVDLNLRDGAILANKVVGELGLLALAIPWLVVVAGQRIREMRAGPARAYFTVMLTVLLCQLLLRGLSYFAGPTCLAILALATLTARGNARGVRPAQRRLRLRRRSSAPVAPTNAAL
jgi:hypothetical protein